MHQTTLIEADKPVGPAPFIGLDLGDRQSHACVVDAATGAVLERFTVRTTGEHLSLAFVGRRSSRVVLEASGPSPWACRLLQNLGHEEMA
jgi:hypothetical protein